MRPYEDLEPKSRASRRAGEQCVEVEEDVFVDRMNGLLDAIARECAAIGRAEDAEAVLEKAATAFEGVQRMCREAGIVQGDGMDDRVTPPKKLSTQPASRVVPVRAQDIRNARGVHVQPTEPRSRGLDLELAEPLGSGLAEDDSPPVSQCKRSLQPPTSGDDIIEVEITEILTSTQEQIQRWKHEFHLQMMDQESKQHDQNRLHMEQIQVLKEALGESQRHIAKLQRTIQETNEKLESMQALTTKSQKAMELTLKEHTQYWKAICNDLVVEKRAIATKLAEERGKYHALREHMDMHDHGVKCETRGSSSPPLAKRSSSPEFPLKASTTNPYLSARKHSSDDTSEDTSGERASFRRYYLAKKPSSSS